MKHLKQWFDDLRERFNRLREDMRERDRRFKVALECWGVRQAVKLRQARLRRFPGAK